MDLRGYTKFTGIINYPCSIFGAYLLELKRDYFGLNFFQCKTATNFFFYGLKWAKGLKNDSLVSKGYHWGSFYRAKIITAKCLGLNILKSKNGSGDIFSRAIFSPYIFFFWDFCPLFKIWPPEWGAKNFMKKLNWGILDSIAASVTNRKHFWILKSPKIVCLTSQML